MLFTCFANLDKMVKQYAETGKKKPVQNIKEKTGRIFPKLLGRPESNIVLTLGTVQNLRIFYEFSILYHVRQVRVLNFFI